LTRFLAGFTLSLMMVLAAGWVAARQGWLPERLSALEARVARKLGWSNGVLAAAGAAAVHAGDPAAAAETVPPTQIGVNLGEARSFANLMLGERWFVPGNGDERRTPVDAALLDRDGNLKALPNTGKVVHPLKEPTTPANGAEFRCTYEGEGDIEVAGQTVTTIGHKPGVILFRYRSGGTERNSIRIELSALNSADPIRDIDCREAALPANVRFDPEFLASLKGFRVLRFMDWQNTNANEAGRWALRATPSSQSIADGTGASIEDMLAVAKAVGADPWLTIPWNADADYVRRFAQLVHAALPANRHVYVEVANEVWNQRFPVSKQAAAEARASGLGGEGERGGAPRMQRYAERVVEVMTIWEQVFAGDPQRLVRVAATQHTNPNQGKAVLAYKDTARHVDALATAPYFGRQIAQEGGAHDMDAAFARLTELVDATIAKAVENKAIARSFGKRYIAYEGGQHIVLRDDVDALTRIQRDPRMYDLYRRYLDGWRTQVGDTLVLFSSVKPINRFGAWGLAEYPGQPESEAPKLRAVRDAIGR
jgi:hypothetical protein